MMLAFFPIRLGLPDQVMANLLDKFLLGAMATSRVAAPRVASTTQPLGLDDNSTKAHTSGDIE
jgi:hypothetical protein